MVASSSHKNIKTSSILRYLQVSDKSSLIMALLYGQRGLFAPGIPGLPGGTAIHLHGTAKLAKARWDAGLFV